ncbi:MAG: transglutaminase domain-containing protein [Lachnospiraceae bacterium]|nr:transglutaminase domain-containing protein [Lachnospiraceae bacterium]
MEPYYYSQMNKLQQSAYHAIKSGLLALAVSFAVPKLSDQELADIFFQLRLDCPEIFYAVSFRYRYYPESSSVELLPEYLFEKGKIKEHQKAMKARVERLLRPVKNQSEREKQQYIHDFICENITYDKLKKPYSHEIIGPLGHGVGVCEGIAKTVKLLCDALGIWCVIAVSEANPEKNIKYRHAWNVVRLNGQYYHMDATFDNTLSHRDRSDANGKQLGNANGKPIRHDYFNLADQWIFRDHEPAMYPIPQCRDDSMFYYREKKLSFTKLEDVEKRAEQAIRKKIPFLFHWRGGYLTREMLQELLMSLQKAAGKKERYIKVNINWPQAVLWVEFEEKEPAEEVVMEEANEGESNFIKE